MSATLATSLNRSVVRTPRPFLLTALAVAATALGGCGGNAATSTAGAAGSAASAGDAGSAGATAGAGGTSSTTSMGGAGTGGTNTGGTGGTGNGGTSTGGASTGGTGGTGTTTSTGFGVGPGDVLDPSQIYILGTVQEGACYMDVLATVSDPNGATAGFGCYLDNKTATIRPTDGRMIYTNVAEDLVREFHCDACTYDGNYPGSPLANDTILPAQPCGQDGFYSLKFLVGPDGTVLHTCKDNALVWYDEGGAVAYDDAGDALLHLGYGGTALTMNRIVDLATQASVDVIGMPYAPIEAIRAVSPGGFLVVVSENQGQELWKIDATGAATLAGAYPAPPAGYNPYTDYQDASRLDPSGALFQTAYKSGEFLDVILRRAIDGTSEIVYTEATMPLVRLHDSGLLTGP